MHNLLVYACKFQDFAQSRKKKFARSHDRTTARFRNSAKEAHRKLTKTPETPVCLQKKTL